MERPERYQLLVQPETRHLVAVSDPDPVRDLVFELKRPSLGSGRLVEMALYLARVGCRIIRFEISDSRLTPIDDQEAEQRSALLAHFVNGDEKFEAQRLLASRPRFYVTGFEVIGEDGAYSTVRQNGALKTTRSATLIGHLDEYYRSAVAS